MGLDILFVILIYIFCILVSVKGIACYIAQAFICTILSVLKSHFAWACIGLFKQLYRLCERRFVRTHSGWLQEVLGLSEVLWVRTVLFVGKCEVRFLRFKKGSRALAIRAKAHRLDQNRQPPHCIMQCSIHWAKPTNLTYQNANNCK